MGSGPVRTQNDSTCVVKTKFHRNRKFVIISKYLINTSMAINILHKETKYSYSNLSNSTNYREQC